MGGSVVWRSDLRETLLVGVGQGSSRDMNTSSSIFSLLFLFSLSFWRAILVVCRLPLAVDVII